MRCEDGCTRLNGTLSIELEGSRDDLQLFYVLVPVRRLSLDRNVCGLRRYPMVGYGNEKLSLEERIFLDTWDIKSSKD